MWLYIEWLLIVVLLFSLSKVMYSDITTRTISNNTTIVIFIVSLTLGYIKDNYSVNLIILIIVVAFLVLLFLTPKYFGGGDAKLFLSLIPFIGFDDFPFYLLFTNVIGLFVALYYKNKGVKEVPFGVAISLAAILLNINYLGHVLL